MTTKIYSFLFLSMIFLAACGSKSEPASEQPEEENNEIVLDRKAAADNRIVSGQASMQTFKGVVKANGLLKVLPQVRRVWLRRWARTSSVSLSRRGRR